MRGRKNKKCPMKTSNLPVIQVLTNDIFGSTYLVISFFIMMRLTPNVLGLNGTDCSSPAKGRLGGVFSLLELGCVHLIILQKLPGPQDRIDRSWISLNCRLIILRGTFENGDNRRSSMAGSSAAKDRIGVYGPFTTIRRNFRFGDFQDSLQQGQRGAVERLTKPSAATAQSVEVLLLEIFPRATVENGVLLFDSSSEAAGLLRIRVPIVRMEQQNIYSSFKFGRFALKHRDQRFDETIIPEP